MTQSWSPVRAAIDIGSNTIHIVVARAAAHTLDILADAVELVRIGESVTASGQISQEKCDRAISVLAQYKALAEQHNAQEILVVATEAIRQASNSDWFIETVRQKTALQINLISGNTEATLTFAGATYEAMSQPRTPEVLGVMDLGGGSMELVTAYRARINWKTSVPIGSGWLHDRFLTGDPPDHAAIMVAETFLHTYFQGMRFKHAPPLLIATGGSANSLLHLTHRAFRQELDQTQLTQHDLLRCQGLLSALPAAEIARRFEQPVERVLILLAGALIIQEMMSRLSLSEIRVSPHGIREGVLLARENYGQSWLDKVSGKTLPEDNQDNSSQTALSGLSMPASPAEMLNGAHPAQGETFEQAARRVLPQRLQKFLELPGEVLKHKDVEAVHKMRVASRRLRAALDAFESCCHPKPFQRLYRRLTTVADALGDARDTDVMLQQLQTRLDHTTGDAQAGLQWLIERLQGFRREKQDLLEHVLAELDSDSLEKLLEACLSQKEEVRHGKS